MIFHNPVLKVKRLVLTILSLLYLATATGANLQLHYCMGKLAGWGFGSKMDRECQECGMEKNSAEANGCCKDEFKHIQLKIDQKSPNTEAYQFHPATGEYAHALSAATAHLQIEGIIYTHILLQPPRCSHIATYIRNCNFRI